MSNQRKGLHPLAWVAIGCGAVAIIGVLIVVLGVGFAVNKGKDMVAELGDNPARLTAELITRTNPDLDLVSVDDATGVVVVENNKTGETLEVNYKDLENGNFEFKTSEGSMRIDAEEGIVMTDETGQETGRISTNVREEDVPDWVPMFANAGPPQGAFTQRSNDTTIGAFSMPFTGDMDAVVDFYRTALGDLGLEVSEQTMASGDQRVVLLIGTSQSGERTLNVSIADSSSDDPNQSQIGIQYSQKG
ncbi:MAG: hypothetical protein AAF772_09665 [Acidobacteriota bacterium]